MTPPDRADVRNRIALVVLCITLLALHGGHGPSLGADDHGQYLLHARALLEGRAYADIGFLHSRYSTLVAPVAEPPGLPTLLAAAMAAAGESWQAARSIILLAFALVGLAVWQAMAHERRGTAEMVSAWTLVALAAQHAPDTALADLPFVAAWWTTCALADRVHRGDHARLRWAGLVAAGCAAFAFRMAALPLLPLAATMCWQGRRDRHLRLGWFVAGAVWTLAAAAILVGLSSGSALGQETLRDGAALARDLRLNAQAIMDGLRAGLIVRTGIGAVDKLLHLSMIALALTGALRRWRAGQWPPSLVLAAWYLVMLALLPTRSARYLWPLYPLVAVCLLDGLVAIAAHLRRPARAPALLGLVLALATVQQALQPVPPTFHTSSDVGRVVEELQRRVPPGDGYVAFFSPRVLTWHTRIRSAPPFGPPIDRANEFLDTQPISHIVTGDPTGWALGATGMDSVVAGNARLREVWHHGPFRIFEVLRSR